MLVHSLTHNGKPLHLFAHSLNHLLIVGQTGSGKTTSTVALLSDYQRANRAAIILDPTGEYRHLPNTSVYRLGDNCYLDAGKLSVAQLMQALELPHNDQWYRLLADATTSLKVAKNINQQSFPLKKLNLPTKLWKVSVSRLGNWAQDYQVDQLPEQLIAEMVLPDPVHPNYSLLGQVNDNERIRRNWPLINHLRTQLADERFQKLFGLQTVATSYELTYVLQLFLSQPMQHQSMVLDLSLLQGQGKLQRLLVSLICQTILRLRLATQQQFPVTIVVDEAHRYLPHEDQQLANNGIFQVLREGRKVNLSMLMTTQSPLDLSPCLRSEFGNVLLHRLNGSGTLRQWPELDEQKIANQQVGTATYLSNQQLTQVKVAPPHWWRKEHSNGLYS